MRPRLLIIIIAILVVIGIVLAVIFRLRQAQEAPRPADNPVLPVVQTTPDGGITFTTPGGVVRTRDFYAAAVASSTYEITLYDDPASGAIYFDPITRSFNVLVMAPYLADFRTLRPQLEARLLEILGISAEDACKLPVFLNARSPGIESLDSAELGLSFCAGAIPTP